MGVGGTGDRLDPLDRRGHDRAVAAPASRARGAGSAPDAGAGSVGGAPRRGALRSLPRRRGAPHHRTATDLRPRRDAADRHRCRRMSTATTGRGGFAALDACVHCGFCLQACPTFLATGDEADGPRGRIELMRALERGELSADDPSLIFHLDRCLACRGCEPVCPSGVGYGRGLEAARALLTQRRGVPSLVRAALGALTVAEASRIVYALARLVRATGIPRRLAGWGRIRFALGMLAATAPKVGGGRWRSVKGSGGTSPNLHQPPPTSPVLLFRGCVMEGLFSHVHDATLRTLQVNGYAVGEAPAQVCCGALHAHAGLRDEARGLARTNLAAFGNDDTPIVVNSAGCGAMLKEYGHL